MVTWAILKCMNAGVYVNSVALLFTSYDAASLLPCCL